MLIERNDNYRSLRLNDPRKYFAGIRREWAYRREESDHLRNDLIDLGASVNIRDSFAIYPELGEGRSWPDFKRKMVKDVLRIRI